MSTHTTMRARPSLRTNRYTSHRPSDTVHKRRHWRAVLDELCQARVLACLGKEDVSSCDRRSRGERDSTQGRVGRDLEERSVPNGGELSVDRLERGCMGEGEYKLGHAKRGSIGGCRCGRTAGAWTRRKTESDVDGFL